MDIGFNILLIIHLVALVVGAATAVAMPLVGRQMAQAAPEARAGFGAIARRLSLNSRVALGMLVASGLTMLGLRYGGVEGMSPWFWAKMALVGTIMALTIAGIVLRPGTLNPGIFGWVTRAVLLGIVICSVFAFN